MNQEEIGTIMRTTGSFYRVRLRSGKLIECTLRGKIRTQELRSTNPVAVGDLVSILPEAGGETGTIVSILPRRNYILRKSVKLSSQFHILCSNVDQAILIATVEEPFTPLGYIDRFLVSCEAFHIPAIIIFNKTDRLHSPRLQDKAADFYRIYRSCGYPVFPFCATDAELAGQAREILEGKTSFLAGHSGSGKSTFINLADSELHLRTGQISTSTGKGKHTTTYAEMFELSFGGFVIDAPGFKEMELYEFSRQELSHYFPEMRKYLSGCRFNDCTHTKEPGCAIRQELLNGNISESRYNTYLSMLDEMA
jgi:ribosome biogenesis GTPase